MWLLVDFGFVPMTSKKWDKILQKWDIVDNLDFNIQRDRSNVVRQMRKEQKKRSNYDLKPNLEFLKKSYTDPVTNAKRKLTTGIAMIPEKDSKKIEVDYLIGNPKAIKDPKFKGALDSLDKKVGTRKIRIEPASDKLDDLYKKKFGDRLIT